MKNKIVGWLSMRRGGWWSVLRYVGFASMLWAGIALGAEPAATSGLVVDEDGRDCPARTHHSIQQAVDDAIAQALARSESEVTPIRVCPGSYHERIRIHAPHRLKIEIRGDNTKGEVVIKGDNPGIAGPIIDVQKAGIVRLRDLTVDGQSHMEPAQDKGAVWGIRYRKTSGVIDHVKVRNMRNTHGDAQGVGIHIQGADDASSGQQMQVDIQSTYVLNATRVGILVEGHGVRAIIEDSQVTGPVDAKVWAPNGIQLSHGAMGEVRRNTVQHVVSPTAPKSIGAGILIHCAGPSRVKENTVSHADVAIALVDTQGADVEHNELTANGFGLVLQTIGHLFGDPGCGVALQPPVENSLQDNHIVSSDTIGIQYKSFDLDVGVPRQNVTAKNIIEGNGFFGIHVVHGSRNRFHDNVIIDDSPPHIVDETMGDGTAGSANEWTDNICPASELDKLCSGRP